jgi:hypothetical protein
MPAIPPYHWRLALDKIVGEGRIIRSRAASRSRNNTHGKLTFTVNMVLALALKAELNGQVLGRFYAILAILILHRVTDLRPNDTEDSPFFYTFKVQCTSCRETHPNPVSVNRFEMNEQSGSKGEANFVWRCKNCKVDLPFPPYHYRLLTLL